MQLAAIRHRGDRCNQVAGRFRRRGEDRRLHLHAGGDAEHRHAVTGDGIDVSRRAVAAREQDEVDAGLHHGGCSALPCRLRWSRRRQAEPPPGREGRLPWPLLHPSRRRRPARQRRRARCRTGAERAACGLPTLVPRPACGPCPTTIGALQADTAAHPGDRIDDQTQSERAHQAIPFSFRSVRLTPAWAPLPCLRR